MKHLFLFTFLSLVLFSCSGNKKQAEVTTFELDELLAVAENHLEDTLTVVGYVTHTCVHSGQRCFIVGESQKVSLRVEATGEIGGFDSELVGAKLSIKGILKENRLSQEYINEMENEVKQLEQEDGSAETCAAELSNINDMRNWMQENNKDYYVIYYMDGLSYEKLE